MRTRTCATYPPVVPDPLELPRSALLALWLPTSDPTGLATAVQGSDEPHTGLAEVVRDWGGPGVVVAAALPVPGDAAAVPPAVSAVAQEAGECVLLERRASGGEGTTAAVAVPDVAEFGSDLEPGWLVTWRLVPVEPWSTRFLGTVGSLAEAELELRTGLQRATEALASLDVARWRDDAAEAIARLRGEGAPPWDLPAGLSPRRVRVLALAARLRAIVDLATVDDGGAVNLWQADQRTAALRDVERVARRALASATLTAT